MCQMNDDLHERRKWLKEYFESTNAMVRRSRPKDFWFTCPVCGHPTHLERGGFDIATCAIGKTTARTILRPMR